MANSKSNIYPIQLQGAELNLNKLDAEIKQYSGFNKNNAPFVGGCLSNVFTRTQSVEGADDDNTYIDTNGDVYEAKDGFFKKNGAILFNIPNEGFERVELIDDEVIKYFNEDLFIIKRYRTPTEPVYSLCMGSKENYVDLEYGADYIGIGDDEFEQKGFNGEFLQHTDSEDYIFILSYRLRNYLVYICVSFEPSESQQFVVKTLNVVKNNTCKSEFSPVAVIINTNHNQVLFFYKSASYTEDINDYSSGYYPTCCFACTLNNDYTLTPLNSGNEITGVKYNIVDNKYIYNNIKYYTVSSSPVYGGLMFVYQSSARVNSKPTVIAIKSPYCDSGLITTESENLVTGYASNETGTLPITIKKITIAANGTFTPKVTAFDIPEGLQYNDVNRVIWQHIITLSNIRASGISFPAVNGFHFKDEIAVDGTSFSLGTFAFGSISETTVIPDKNYFNLLINNNFLSGISASKVLLEGWNNIDEWSLSVFWPKKQIFYKSNGKYYVIKATSKIKIKRLNNQLVLNVDSYKNSYDIKRNKILYFAPSYNNYVFPNQSYGTNFLPTLQNQQDNIFVGIAINEYKQEDNSSILLNPVGCYYANQNVKTKYIPYWLENRMPEGCNINFYGSDDNSAEIVYIMTLNGENKIIDQKLINLPFPSDTNGNVEYSPDIFSEVTQYGTNAFIKSGDTAYPLVMGNNNEPIMSFYMASGIENLKTVFIIQGQYYGTIGNKLFSMQFANGVVTNVSFIVDITGLEFVGNTPYEALFFSKTNRCLFSFTGANILTQKQFIDKISKVEDYLYNPATQTVFLITDIGVLFYGLFGQFLLEYTDISKIFLLNNGIVMSNNSGNYRYIKYYLDEGDTDFEKHNINLETCFYGMNNQTVTINDCLYFRLFSEEHEEGSLKVSATTISLRGRKTEETTFKIRASDWDKLTHTIYLRYQPKEQRGLGISFSINSPFKIASLSVGSQADAILVDKVSKGAINAPQRTSNNVEW